MQTQKIYEQVSVSFVFSAESMEVAPLKVKWKNRVYLIKKVGLHHKFREGRTLIHIFSVVTDTCFMRLALNTETLAWKLEEIGEVYPYAI